MYGISKYTPSYASLSSHAASTRINERHSIHGVPLVLCPFHTYRLDIPRKICYIIIDYYIYLYHHPVHWDAHMAQTRINSLIDEQEEAIRFNSLRKQACTNAIDRATKIRDGGVKMSDDAFRKIVKTEMVELVKNTLGESVEIERILDADINEIIEEHCVGKAPKPVDLNPRVHVIPSKVYNKDSDLQLGREESLIIDNDQFDVKLKERFRDDMITEYIDIMFTMFDIDPYYEREKKIKGKNGQVMYERETVPNDLPLFSEFGFRAGLTEADIDTLKKGNERFAHAYEMCREKQEYILVTNMLLGLYRSQPGVFAAKNLLGWRNEDRVDVTGKLDMSSIINDVVRSNDDDFVDEDDIG